MDHLTLPSSFLPSSHIPWRQGRMLLAGLITVKHQYEEGVHKEVGGLQPIRVAVHRVYAIQTFLSEAEGL